MVILGKVILVMFYNITNVSQICLQFNEIIRKTVKVRALLVVVKEAY